LGKQLAPDDVENIVAFLHVRLPLQDIQLSRQLGYILHTERTLSNAARAFMRLLDEQAFGNGTPAA
ncbi:hypothetical protein ACLBVR_27815, partial [Pseudomonas aeruginosa]